MGGKSFRQRKYTTHACICQPELNFCRTTSKSGALRPHPPPPLPHAGEGGFLLQFGGFGKTETAKLPIIPPPLTGAGAGGGVI